MNRVDSMNNLLYTLKSKYCIGVFAVSLILGYISVPKSVFYGIYLIFAGIFIISFALTLTCVVRNVKEKIVLARTYKSSLVGIIATGVGLAALQVCGVGAPVCGATVGLGILSAIFPIAFVDILSKYSLEIIVVSIIFQLGALYFMNCFEQIGCVKNTRKNITKKLIMK